MNKHLLAFSISLVLLSISIAVITGQIANPSFLRLILISLTVATWLVYFFVQRTKREDFIKNYLLTIVLKLLAGGIFISILIFIDRTAAEANAIFFMTSYFLLTGLEVGFLFGRLK